MSVDVGKAVGYLDLDISGFLKGLKSAQAEAEAASQSISAKLGKDISNAGKSLSSAGSSLTKAVTVPIVGVGAAAVKTGANFESAMSKVSAISGATGNDLKKLNLKAQEMGAKTKFSATESAEAFQYMAMAGWKTGDMLDGIEGIMNLAAADGLDLATTSDIVTDALTAFGLQAKDSGHFADVLAKASSNANTNVSLLGESFKYAAPVAGALGYSVEDTSIALGLMANAGIKGSQGGTALRASLSRLVKPTDAVAGAMDKYGISLTNSDGSMKSLGEVMGILREKLGGLSEAEKAQAAATLFGQEAMSGMLAIINASDSDYDKLTNAIYDADGAAKQMSETMLDNLNGQITLLKSALEGLAIQISDILMPYIKSFVSWLQKLVEKLQGMSKEQKESIAKWAMFAAAIGPVLLIVGKLTTGIVGFITTIGKIPGAINTIKTDVALLKTAFVNVGEGIKLARAGFPGFASEASKLGAAIGGISAPVAIVIAAIAGLVAAFITLWNTNEQFRNKVTEIWNGVTQKLSEAGKKIGEALSEIGISFGSIVDVLKTAWEGLCNLIGPLFIAAIDTVAEVIKGIVDIVTGVIQVIAGILKGFKDGDWSMFLDGLKSLFDGFIGIITAPFKGVFEGFKYILEGFGTTWENVWNGIVNFFSSLWDGVTATFQSVWNGISSFFSGVWAGICNVVSVGLDSISTFFTNTWNGITSFLSSTWDTIKNVIQVGIMFIGELLNAGFQIITLPFQFIWQNCSDFLISIWNSMKSFVQSTLQSISDNIITPILSAIQTTFSMIWNKISSVVVSIITSISNFISQKFNAISAFMSSLWSSVVNIATSKWNELKTSISNILTSINNVISNIWNSIKSFVVGVWNSLVSSATSSFNSMKLTISGVLNGIKSTFSSIWNGIKSTVMSVVNSIATGISNAFNSAKNAVGNILNGIKSQFINTFNGIKSFMSGIVNWLKGIFNFNWSLPKIKLPHFKISGKFSLNPPSVPSFGIDWYRKAMNNGMIMNSPTLFGYDVSTGKFLGGGEAGSETVVGTNSLMSMINSSVQSAIGGISDILKSGQFAGASGDIVIPVYIGNEMIDELVVKAINRNNYRSGGR